MKKIVLIVFLSFGFVSQVHAIGCTGLKREVQSVYKKLKRNNCKESDLHYAERVCNRIESRMCLNGGERICDNIQHLCHGE